MFSKIRHSLPRDISQSRPGKDSRPVGISVLPSSLLRCVKITLLLVSCLLIWLAARSTVIPYFSSKVQEHPENPKLFPPTHVTDLRIHDPSIIRVGDTYYAYSVGKHIAIHQAPNLDGPWEKTGSVLSVDSVIPKGDRAAPWAPTTIQMGDKFYCYYAVSNAGCRDSAIGVASSDSPGPGGWTDHGLIIQTGKGKGSEKYPFHLSNAIDPSVFVADDGQAFLSFGSFWTGIWQIPLGKDLISHAMTGRSDARQLASEPEAIWPGRKNADGICGDKTGAHPVEGAFISYHEPYYYLWFSWGRCCDITERLLKMPGREYSIRVGRSDDPRGPFVDRQGRDLVDGGGELVYASNREVYAPGGQGILTENGSDILYYHYLNRSISYDFWEARLGYNPLVYIDGWPVAE